MNVSKALEALIQEKDKRIQFLEAQSLRLIDALEKMVKEHTYFTSGQKGNNPLKRPMIFDEEKKTMREMSQDEHNQHFHDLQELGIL